MLNALNQLLQTSFVIKKHIMGKFSFLLVPLLFLGALGGKDINLLI